MTHFEEQPPHTACSGIGNYLSKQSCAKPLASMFGRYGKEQQLFFVEQASGQRKSGCGLIGAGWDIAARIDKKIPGPSQYQRVCHLSSIPCLAVFRRKGAHHNLHDAVDIVTHFGAKRAHRLRFRSAGDIRRLAGAHPARGHTGEAHRPAAHAPQGMQTRVHPAKAA